MISQDATATLRLLAKRWQPLAEELKTLDAMLDRLTSQHARRLRERFGVGPQTAAVLVAVADIHGYRGTVVVSLELAAAKWKVALHDGQREQPAIHTVAQPQAAAHLQAVLDLIEHQKHKWSLPAGVRLVVATKPARTHSGSIARCRQTY